MTAHKILSSIMYEHSCRMAHAYQFLNAKEHPLFNMPPSQDAVLGIFSSSQLTLGAAWI